MSLWGQYNLQEGASPLMEQLIFFHDHAMLILILVVSIVSYASVALLTNKYSYRFLLEGREIETIWTILPACVLIFLALPSLRLLYSLDEIYDPALTVKSIGHQWYWSYEYSDLKNLEFDSFMLNEDQIQSGDYRLLETNNRVVIPINTSVRMLITSNDVIHCWTVPALGVKADAVPGRLNQISFSINRPGVFYGQCSEICGANHSFMPISLEAVSMNTFMNWMKNN
uniref:Cytochrome c oxidase subunit 2 n=1 Tax=Scutopus ventrolineatus TaxID=52922 RepID=A0A096XEA6_SCUVE|nr:cytochrome c oxidase subunit II [Scutopus ventrolineatus]AHI45694.1 cytochrome c oxidase subunit II [Scutopus ventrolineatus]